MGSVVPPEVVTSSLSSSILVNGANGHLELSPLNGGAKVTVVLGAQWGDEGKGKLVDLLATDVDIVCRCQVWAWRFIQFTI